MNNPKKTVWLKVSVPIKLKEDFKIACWLENISQTDKMLELMSGLVTTKRKHIEEAREVRS